MSTLTIIQQISNTFISQGYNPEELVATRASFTYQENKSIWISHSGTEGFTVAIFNETADVEQSLTTQSLIEYMEYLYENFLSGTVVIPSIDTEEVNIFALNTHDGPITAQMLLDTLLKLRSIGVDLNTPIKFSTSIESHRDIAYDHNCKASFEYTSTDEDGESVSPYFAIHTSGEEA